MGEVEIECVDFIENESPLIENYHYKSNVTDIEMYYKNVEKLSKLINYIANDYANINKVDRVFVCIKSDLIIVSNLVLYHVQIDAPQSNSTHFEKGDDLKQRRQCIEYIDLDFIN